MHVLALVLAVSLSSAAFVQPSVKAVSASVVADQASPTMATALVILENGTMYDVYVVGAGADVAESVELREKVKGATSAATVKEAPVPAFGQLEMSADGVHLALINLKRPLKAGEMIPLTLAIDNGVTLTIQAVVR
jgi:copper(I)-binding protein